MKRQLITTQICLVLSLASVVSTPEAMARQLSLDEALRNSSMPTLSGTTRSGAVHLYTENAGDLKAVYIVSNSNGKGYVALAADDILPAVLGYSENGEFDPGNIPPAMAGWLEEYGRQLAYAYENGYTRAELNDGRKPIAPLCKTKWNQTSPYSDKSPLVNGKRTPVGCTATAMAQVIKVHRWPDKGVGANTYEWDNNGTKENLTFDFGSTTFDWDNAIDVYKVSKYTPEQAEAVSTISLACGNCAHMAYSENSSGAWPYDGAYGLVKFMKYDRSVFVAERNYYPAKKWNEMLYEELAAGRPLVYTGYNTTGGHTFVVDGYDGNGYYHVNWGWGGSSDGYFIITALDPAEQGVGGSSAGYNTSQQCIFNLKPAKDGVESKYVTNVYCDGVFSTGATSYKGSEKIKFTSLGNSKFNAFTFEDKKIVTLGVRITAEGSQTGTFISGWNVEYKSHYGKGKLVYPSFEVPVSSMPKSGKYTVTPAYKIDDVIYDMPVRLGCRKSVTMTCSDTGVTFESIPLKRELKVSDFKSVSPTYVGKNCLFTARISNTGEEYYGTVKAMIEDDMGSTLSELPGVVIDLADGESVEVRFEGKFMNAMDKKTALSAAKYNLYIYDDNLNRLNSEPFEVTLADAGENAKDCTLAYTIDGKVSGNGSYDNPYIVGDEIKLSLKISVTKGVFEENHVYLYAYKSDGGAGVGMGAGSRQKNSYLVDTSNPQTKEYVINTSEFPVNAIVHIHAFAWADSFVQDESRGFIGNKIYFKKISTGIGPVEKEEKTMVYPNPAGSSATVTSANPIKTVEIFSLSGSMAASVKGDMRSCAAEIDVSSLPAGHYVVVVRTAVGVERCRLIKK